MSIFSRKNKEELKFYKTKSEFVSEVFGRTHEEFAVLTEALYQVLVKGTKRKKNKTEVLEQFLAKTKIKFQTPNDFLLLGMAFSRAVVRVQDEFADKAIAHLTGAVHITGKKKVTPENMKTELEQFFKERFGEGSVLIKTSSEELPPIKPIRKRTIN